MSYLGPEAGYIIIALTSVPLGAFLLPTITKPLVFIASLGTGPGKKQSYTLPSALQILMNVMTQEYPQFPICTGTTVPRISSLALHFYSTNSPGKLISLQS